jgi:hypothetical protein
MTLLRQITHIALSAFVGAVFVSCSTLSTSQTKEYVLTLNLSVSDTQQGLIQRYGGTVLSYNQKAGFAILKVNKLPDSTDKAVKHLEPNGKLETTDAKMSLNQPNITTQGTNTQSASVGMNGWATWSSGWSTWSSGWATWSSGQTLPATSAQTSNVYMSSRVPQAHAIARNFGTGVIVAVLDTGIDLNHPGFNGRLIDSAKRWNFVDNNNDVAETNNGNGYGHGTAVAGVVLQVAPKATIMPLKVLDSNGSGDLDNIIAAIDYAVRNGARVINISLGSTEYSDALWTVIDNALNNNVYVVASVGNDSKQNAATYPGAMGYWWTSGKMIGVGSINDNDQVSSFSNSGDDVYMYAPGENVPTYAPNNRTANATGTSFASPLVAGAIALAYGEAPNAYAQEQIGNALWSSNDHNRVWWRNYAEQNSSCTSPNGNWCFGQGTLDVEDLLLNAPGFVPAYQKSDVDFVRNSGFEIGSLDGWTTSNIAISSGFSGKHSALIIRGGSMTQRLTGLLSNTTYRLAAWVVVYNETEPVRFMIRNFAGRNSNVNVKTTAQNAWYFRPISLTFTTGWNSTSADLVIDKTLGYGDAYIDSVSVTRVW